MTHEQFRELVRQALCECPAKAARINLLFRDRRGGWNVVLDAGGGEFAVRVAEEPGSSPEALKDRILEQVRALF